MSTGTSRERLEENNRLLNLSSTNLQIIQNTLNNLPVYVNTFDANATTNDILKNKTAYVGGVKIVGNLDSGMDLTNTNLNINDLKAKSVAYSTFTSLYPSTSITSLYNAFSGYTNLEYMPNIDTHLITNMNNTFNGCINLLNLPELNTDNLTDCVGMFRNCRSLTTIPNMNTTKVDNLFYMFVHCWSLTNVPNFNTSNVVNLGSTFFNCTNLTTLPNWDLSNAVQLGAMCSRCENLTNIPNYNTVNAQNMVEMFNNCFNLTTAANFDTSNVLYMSNMFYGCNNLQTIYPFNTSNVVNMSLMFYNCINLTNESYANIVNSLPLASNLTSTKVSNIGLDLDRLTKEQINILNSKGYTDTIPVLETSNTYNIYYT